MSGPVTPARLHLAKQAVRGVRENGPVRDDELAAILGCDLAELRTAIGIAIRWRRIDRCDGWLVPTPARREERPAA
jgi:hypothetical protein